MMLKKSFFLALTTLLAIGMDTNCQAQTTPRPSATPRPSTTPRPSSTPRPSATPRVSATPRPSATPTPTPTPAPPTPQPLPGDAEFSKHRPVFHFLARKNWMNDPCGPYFDAKTGWYHLFYQSNPNQSRWGNMTWGHAISRDQVTWYDRRDALSPGGDNAYDKLGIFSGFTVPNAIDGKDTIFYTGVNHLPISYKLPKKHDPEHVMYATTDDNGETWQKGSEPLIMSPPKELNVTSWRDPFVFNSVALDQKFGLNNQTTSEANTSHWMLVPGGQHSREPRLFLYHSFDYRRWDYKGFLFAQKGGSRFGNANYSTGSFGHNFEMSNYFEVQDDEGYLHSMMLVGTEGGRGGKKNDHYALWMEVSLNRTTNDTHSSIFNPEMVGVADYGGFYASAVYRDPVTNKYVTIGWVKEENGYSGDELNGMGWAGVMSLPREMSMLTIRNVYDPENFFDQKGSFRVIGRVQRGQYQTKTIQTLGVRPVGTVATLRGRRAFQRPFNLRIHHVSETLPVQSRAFELQAEIRNFTAGSKVGFQVRIDDQAGEVTSIYYDDAVKKVIVDRSKSCNHQCHENSKHKPDLSNDEAPFHLFNIVGQTGQVAQEALMFRVFVDVSYIEVYLNDRLALSSRIYPCASETATSIALVASHWADFHNVQLWTDARRAWPERLV